RHALNVRAEVVDPVPHGVDEVRIGRVGCDGVLVVEAHGALVLNDGDGVAPAQAAVDGLADQHRVVFDRMASLSRREAGCQGEMVQLAVGGEGEPGVGGDLVRSPGNQGDSWDDDLLPGVAAVEADTGNDPERSAAGREVLLPGSDDVPWV